jgi:hypothetical protein
MRPKPTLEGSLTRYQAATLTAPWTDTPTKPIRSGSPIARENRGDHRPLEPARRSLAAHA